MMARPRPRSVVPSARRAVAGVSSREMRAS
nr:MAG TPA: hypothetical protein [Caudoviricetes sp.]